MSGDGDAGALSAAWQVWIAESLLRGFTEQSVLGRLVEAGMEDEAARAAVREIARSPGVIAARRVHAEPNAAVLACELARATERIGGARLPVRPAIDERELRDVYVAHGVPVLVPGYAAESEAVRGWSPRSLAERFGDALVRVCVGRDSDPHPDRRYAAHTIEEPLRDYVARVLAAGDSNDLYMVAQHRNLEGALAALVDELPTPPMVERARRASCTSLWFGPGGTHTPAHHDTTNVLFCQIYGHKRVWLASPAQVSLARGAQGFYAGRALSAAGVDDLPVYDVTLQPGDLLLIPAGWWHEVRAMSVSISVSFTGLDVPNRYDFYTPGQLARA